MRQDLGRLDPHRRPVALLDLESGRPGKRRAESHVNVGRSLAGGKRQGSVGYFYEPTLIADLAQDDEAASDVGLGIPWSLIDVAGIEAIEYAFVSGEGSLLYRPRIHLAVDGKPGNVKRLLQPEWHSVSCVLTAGKGGLLTVVRLSDSPTPGAITITTDGKEYRVKTEKQP